ncbi:MAG: hypothetical protein JNM99_15570 [Verrucomicrobiaceae bacterium]|nr:hypothetical protein [Verrucomicrobiaceae bacterium]
MTRCDTARAATSGEFVIRHSSFVIPSRVWLSMILAVLGCLTAFAQEEAKVPFIEQTLQRSDDFYSSGMKSLVGDVVKVTGVAGDVVQELQKVATAAVKDKMDKSKVGLWKTWHAMQKDGEVDQIQFWNSYRKLPEAILTPDRSPIWGEGLKRLLKPDELAKWDAEATKRRARIEKAIADYLDRGRKQWKDQRVETRKAQVEELVTINKLDAASTTKIRNGIDGAVSAALPDWGKGLEKSIREYVKSAFLGGADDRVQALEGGQINFGSAGEPDAVAAEEAGWRGLLKQSLSVEQFGQWEAREQQRLDRRLRAMAMMTVAELDRKLRLTMSQRSTLEERFVKVISEGRSKMDALFSQNYANSEIMLMVLNGIPDAEVKALLEEEQLVVWRDVAARYSSWWNQF